MKKLLIPLILCLFLCSCHFGTPESAQARAEELKAQLEEKYEGITFDIDAHEEFHERSENASPIPDFDHYYYVYTATSSDGIVFDAQTENYMVKKYGDQAAEDIKALLNATHECSDIFIHPVEVGYIGLTNANLPGYYKTYVDAYSYLKQHYQLWYSYSDISTKDKDILVSELKRLFEHLIAETGFTNITICLNKTGSYCIFKSDMTDEELYDACRFIEE